MNTIPNSLADWLKSASIEVNARLILCAGGISGRYLEGIEKERGCSFHALPRNEKLQHVQRATTVERNVIDWQRKAARRAQRQAMFAN